MELDCLEQSEIKRNLTDLNLAISGMRLPKLNFGLGDLRLTPLINTMPHATLTT